ncbi:MAG: FlgD immunoglobulin-like domain containing protein [candidate division KSB1 bacterium]|nr:FlgD immunoglobulin-like domain containing protein [candidate division KSB1 bacterium]
MNKILYMLVLAVSTVSLYAQNVIIEWNTVHQTIDGFGGSDAWFADDISIHPDRDALLDLLFSRESGAGLSIYRHRIPPGESDWLDFQVDLNSNDLDFGSRPVHGVRFQNAGIPREVDIDSAFVRFTAKDNGTAECNLQIDGQSSGDAEVFADTPGNLSGRLRTTAAVSWQVPAWTGGEHGKNQRTPDLDAVVQEIVNQEDWQSGNSLVIFIRNLTGKRSASTYDRDPSQAPELVVYYDNDRKLTCKVNTGIDDAEENKKSYITYAAELTQDAFELGCRRVWSAAWTPPAEWKTNKKHNNGGYLEFKHYQDWADRLERYRDIFETRSGIPLYGISPQNEPGEKPWESCQWTAENFKKFIKNNLGPTLDPACQIIAPEETNWNRVDEFYQPVHEDEQARQYVDILAGHVYGGNAATSYNHFGKPVWQTEWSYNLADEDLSINSGLVWAKNIWTMLVNAEIRAFHYWWLVNLTGDDRQQGLISADKNQSGYSVSKRLWTIGQYSRFVRPGWVRINSTKQSNTDLYTAAFRDTGSQQFAIVVINESNTSRTLTFQFKDFTTDSLIPYRTSSTENIVRQQTLPAGTHVQASLPEKSVTTFTGTAASVNTGVTDGHRDGPELFRLYDNAPNPFNPVTRIPFRLYCDSRVVLDIYDVTGCRIHTLINARLASGLHTVQWDAADENGSKVASGVYFYRLDVRSGSQYHGIQNGSMLYLK